jgi:hypothetical protein
MKRLLYWFVLLSFCAIGASSQTKTKNTSGIRAIDFKNYTYGSGKGKRRVKNGRWNGEYPGEYLQIGKAIYGDLTGDGKEEAVLMVSESGGGSGVSSSCLVFTIAGGVPRELSSRDRDGHGPYSGIVGGDRGDGGIYNVAIKSGLLYVEQYSPGEGPNARQFQAAYIETLIYKWNGNLFILSNKITRRPLP